MRSVGSGESFKFLVLVLHWRSSFLLMVKIIKINLWVLAALLWNSSPNIGFLIVLKTGHDWLFQNPFVCSTCKTNWSGQDAWGFPIAFQMNIFLTLFELPFFNKLLSEGELEPSLSFSFFFAYAVAAATKWSDCSRKSAESTLWICQICSSKWTYNQESSGRRTGCWTFYRNN